LVATGQGVIALSRLQREGKSAQEAAEFIKGSGLTIGDRLGL